MNTKIESLAHIFATIVWADGKYVEEEKELLNEIAEAFEIDANELAQKVDEAAAKLENADEDAANEFLLEACSQVAEGEEKAIFEAVIELALSDGLIVKEEVENILSIAADLNIENTDAVLMILDTVCDDECYQVEIN